MVSAIFTLKIYHLYDHLPKITYLFTVLNAYKGEGGIYTYIIKEVLYKYPFAVFYFSTNSKLLPSTTRIILPYNLSSIAIKSVIETLDSDNLRLCNVKPL